MCILVEISIGHEVYWKFLLAIYNEFFIYSSMPRRPPSANRQLYL